MARHGWTQLGPDLRAHCNTSGERGPKFVPDAANIDAQGHAGAVYVDGTHPAIGAITMRRATYQATVKGSPE